MFSAHCEDCGTKVLLTTRRIERLYNTDRGARAGDIFGAAASLEAAEQLQAEYETEVVA